MESFVKACFSDSYDKLEKVVKVRKLRTLFAGIAQAP